MSNRKKTKVVSNNITKTPQAKMLLYCGGFRDGSENDKVCGNSVISNLGVFSALPRLAGALSQVGWILAKATTQDGGKVHNPLCADCAKKLEEHLKGKISSNLDTTNTDDSGNLSSADETNDHTTYIE